MHTRTHTPLWSLFHSARPPLRPTAHHPHPHQQHLLLSPRDTRNGQKKSARPLAASSLLCPPVAPLLFSSSFSPPFIILPCLLLPAVPQLRATNTQKRGGSLASPLSPPSKKPLSRLFCLSAARGRFVGGGGPRLLGRAAESPLVESYRERPPCVNRFGPAKKMSVRIWMPSHKKAASRRAASDRIAVLTPPHPPLPPKTKKNSPNPKRHRSCSRRPARPWASAGGPRFKRPPRRARGTPRARAWPSARRR